MTLPTLYLSCPSRNNQVSMSSATIPYWQTGGVRAALEFAKDQVRFWRGYLAYLAGRSNDRNALLALRRLFCATNGRFNDAVSFLNGLSRPPYTIDTRDSIVPGLVPARIDDIVRNLDRDGYYLFPTTVSANICDGLIRFAQQTPMTVIAADGPLADKKRIELAAPEGIKYDTPMELLMHDPCAQQVAGDPGLLAIAQAYFRAKAVQDMVAMWWSLPGKKASSEIAQLYHFDMERIKFLKFFLYLSDVGPENGPHCFVKGSHRRLPHALCEHRRFQDEEVFANFPRESEIRVTGPRGLLCAVDTRGLHKGALVTAGHRLVFQVEFSVNMFGGWDYPNVPLGAAATEQFRHMMDLYPESFENYLTHSPIQSTEQ
jgi:hypothetical protein